MLKNCILLALIPALLGCQPNPSPLKSHESDRLKIEQITDNIFKHISYLETESYGKVACNGMIYRHGNEVLIFDTPTNNKASEELIQWIGNRDIKGVVVTHFHIDCLGGLEVFHAKEIQSYANTQTIELARQKGIVLPKNGFEDRMEFQIDDKIALATYFGPGHTLDNTVGYIPSEKALFGGCLIKAMGSGKGNLANAATNEWSTTVEKIKKEFDTLEIVIPGHGREGGRELLDFTIDLFKVE
ncbi:subclass B1 metallo-beta-lactamase [Croceiramulus getboli]|nr:subclass B1 metallo-beta-lactamase [Flavobacteriaceae bacterium YJPT1-3]